MCCKLFELRADDFLKLIRPIFFTHTDRPLQASRGSDEIQDNTVPARGAKAHATTDKSQDKEQRWGTRLEQIYQFVQKLVKVQQGPPPDASTISALENEARGIWNTEGPSEYVGRTSESVVMNCSCCEKLTQTTVKFPTGFRCKWYEPHSSRPHLPSIQSTHHM